VDRGVFLDGLRVLLEKESFGEDVFVFEEEAASFRCKICGEEWGFADMPDVGEEEREAIHFMPEAAHVYMRCPACGSPDFQVERGRGVTIRSIDLETHPEETES
jgi:hydrogenase nickel incorporation protein HypA/HybF